jgi:hypothetical protein
MTYLLKVVIQVIYANRLLMRNLEPFAESLITIQPNQKLRPSTVNVTYSRDFETERNGCEIHDGCVNSLRSTDDQRRGEMQARFRKLLRIGSLGGDAWKPTTPQKTCRLVRALSLYPGRLLVREAIVGNRGVIHENGGIRCHPTMSEVQVCDGKGEYPQCCDNTLILVDTFEDKSRIATSIAKKFLIATNWDGS